MKQRSFAVSLVGGLAIGGLCVGIAFALAIFVILPTAERGTHGLRAYREGDVRIWHAGRIDRVELESVRMETEALVTETARAIGVDPTSLPFPIEIFLHRDMTELTTSVVNRDSDYRSVNWTALDRLPWENSSLRIAELVLAHGWGKCTAQVLYAGMAVYAADPERDYHAFVAALPERARHTVGELISLEASGSFPRTFYQDYASPFVLRFGISLSATKRHFDIPRYFDIAPEAHQLYLEAASLVEYLIEEHRSMEAVREAWDVGASTNILAALSGWSGEELTEHWHAFALQAGRTAVDYPIERVRLLVESGACDEAFALTESWSASGAAPEELELMIVSSILVGDFARTRSVMTQASEDAIDPGVLAWARELVDGSTTTAGTVRIVSGSTALPSDAELRRIETTAEAIAELLGPENAAAIEPTTVIVYSNEAERERAAAFLARSGIPSRLTQVVAGDDIARAIAHALPTYVLGESRSKLLERGLALMVSSDRADLLERATTIRNAGDWQPFGTLSYMGHDVEEADVQSAFLVRAILAEYGAANLRAIWRSTSTLGGGSCLDTALKTHVGITRQELEERLFAVEGTMP